jgi:hypothetical protein
VAVRSAVSTGDYWTSSTRRLPAGRGLSSPFAAAFRVQPARPIMPAEDDDLPIVIRRDIRAGLDRKHRERLAELALAPNAGDAEQGSSDLVKSHLCFRRLFGSLWAVNS